MVGRMGLFARILGLLSLYLFVGCAPTDKGLQQPSTPRIRDENELRVGISTNAPPLIFKRGEAITGLEADFAREFSSYLSKTLRFVELEWEDQIPALLDNRIDIVMSGMSITRLRQVRVAFSTPYLRSGQMALIRREDADRFRGGYYSIALSESIGAVKNTTGEFFVQNRFDKPQKYFYPTAKAGVSALMRRSIDVFIHDAPMILVLASEHETEGLTPIYTLLTEEYLAWAVRKEDVKLLNSANTFIEELTSDGRLKDMVNRWVPFTR